MQLSNLRLRTPLSSLALAASLAAVFLIAGAPEAFAAVAHAAAHGAAPHDLFAHTLTASLSVAALRAKVGDLETRAAGKVAEMKDGLTPEQIRAVEAEHGTLLAEMETARRDLAVAEEAERAAAQAGVAGNGGAPTGGSSAGGSSAGTPELEVIRAQERMAERQRISDVRVTARKLNLTDKDADKAIADGVSIDAFREWAIDEAHKRQLPPGWTAPPAAGETASGRSYAAPAVPVPPGTNAVRCLIALAATRGIAQHAADFVQRHYGLGGEVAARALGTSVGSTGGFLIPPDMAAEVIELLRPASTVMALKPEIVPMPRGQIFIPRQSSGSQASYVGENMPAGASQPGFGGIQLSAHKLVTLVPISNDMIRFAGPATDGIVRNDMIRAIAQRADLAFLRGNGGQFSPRGFLSFAKEPSLGGLNVIAANPQVNLQNVVNDLGKVELALEQANIVMERPGWVLSPRTKTYLQNLRDGLGNPIYEKEMLTGMLRGKPFKVTTQIPNNLASVAPDGVTQLVDGSEVYLADFAQVVIGEVEGLEIATFEGGAYLDANGVLQSGISNDQTVMRTIVQHDMGMRQEAAVAVLIGVRWF